MSLSDLFAKIFKSNKAIQDIKDKIVNCPFMSAADKSAILKIMEKYFK